LIACQFLADRLENEEMTLVMRWGRRGLIALAVLATAYVIALGALFVFQRSLIYHPIAYAAVPDATGPSIQVVEITTDDGERLVGWWLPPQTGRPTILFFSGNGGGLSLQSGRWRRLAGAGVGFLALAYRGYEGSTGRPTEAGLHQDARASYDWLAERMAPDDIVIHGFSLGTGVPSKLATERPARALILEAPYTATVDLARRQFPIAPVSLLLRDHSAPATGLRTCACRF
jgi:fermentation-respiration switch protein FrsA (DUF1100 family)